MQIIDAACTRSALPFDALIDALAQGFQGDFQVPLRHTHELASAEARGTSLLMPAWGAGFYGVKVVNIWPDNHAHGLPGLHSSYLLHDARTGRPLALLDGNEITSRRTAAAAALAARHLARANAERLVLIGCGRVGRLVPHAMRAVRPIRSVSVSDLDADAAATLCVALRADGFEAEVATDLEHAVRTADIVSCATLATAPLVQSAWLAPGSHLDLIGSFTPVMQEADPACFANASVFVDTREAAQKSGDLLRAFDAGALRPDEIRGTLADLCRGRVAGRTDDAGRTVFKAVGTALEDLVAAILTYTAVQADP